MPRSEPVLSHTRSVLKVRGETKMVKEEGSPKGVYAQVFSPPERPLSVKDAFTALAEDARSESPSSDFGAGPSGRNDPADPLDRKLHSTLEKAKRSFKERELYNAVESLETTCELLKESHRRKERETAFDLCSCIAELIVDGVAAKCEARKTETLLRNQRTICEKLQTANELIDAERLAIEYQKYERETELEEVTFKFTEVREKYDLQEGLHQKEQRAFEAASQELKIKYEKHFKSLSAEIENLQRQLSSMEASTRNKIGQLTNDKEELELELEATKAELKQITKATEAELQSKTEIIA